jgi:nucleotidyltransferase substrate binding protein (TIGR01987 family)
MTPKLADAFANYQKAFTSLERALAEPVRTERDIAGVIQTFEFVYELAWKNLKRLLEFDGQFTQTPRETLSAAFQVGFIADESVWLDMMKDRNLSVHTYDEKFAREMLERIRNHYFPRFQSLREFLIKRLAKI